MTDSSPHASPTSAHTTSSEVRKCYLVSSTFDYDATICSDYGPDYAEHMGWDVAGLDDAESAISSYPVVLVDTRYDEAECERLKALVRAHRGTTFGFSVIDPFHWVVDRPYPSMLFELKHEPNVFFLSRYQPKEVVQDLIDGAGPEKLVVIPYAYVPPFQPIDGFEQRHWRLIHSGRHNASRYPCRQTIHRLHKWIRPFRSYVDTLGHPGYPDAGETLQHEVVGDEYIAFLSGYTFMSVTPSRLHLEFLKYRECAMAGCVPVGIPPDGFPNALCAPFVNLSPGGPLSAAFHLTRGLLMRRSEAKDRAHAYRDAYRTHRSPDVLNAKLDAFLDETGRT